MLCRHYLRAVLPDISGGEQTCDNSQRYDWVEVRRGVERRREPAKLQPSSGIVWVCSLLLSCLASPCVSLLLFSSFSYPLLLKMASPLICNPSLNFAFIASRHLVSPVVKCGLGMYGEEERHESKVATFLDDWEENMATGTPDADMYLKDWHLVRDCSEYEVIITFSNYHMIGMYFTIQHYIRVPMHVLSTMISGLLLDKRG